ARNAHLNFNRLGVRLAEYVEDMYGVTDSVLHGGMPTDRIVVAWPTADDELAACLADAGRARSSVACRESPVVNDEWIASALHAGYALTGFRLDAPADRGYYLMTRDHESSSNGNRPG